MRGWNGGCVEWGRRLRALDSGDGCLEPEGRDVLCRGERGWSCRRGRDQLVWGG